MRKPFLLDQWDLYFNSGFEALGCLSHWKFLYLVKLLHIFLPRYFTLFKGFPSNRQQRDTLSPIASKIKQSNIAPPYSSVKPLMVKLVALIITVFSQNSVSSSDHTGADDRLSEMKNVIADATFSASQHLGKISLSIFHFTFSLHSSSQGCHKTWHTYIDTYGQFRMIIWFNQSKAGKGRETIK